jgi:imidazole glycerol-phosphate synthase subunit HisH
MKVAIVDYGAGNLASLKAAFEAIGAEPHVTSDPQQLEHADRIVVPGVGHFSATAQLDERGLSNSIRNAIDRGKPLLGICLGMQWLFESSEEASDISGLGAFTGSSRRFPHDVKTPHVGWNQLQLRPGVSRLLQGIPDSSYAYFTHSYRIEHAAETVATSEYAGEFSAVVERDNIFGVQFHPEKSSTVGLAILRNFCALPC